VREQIEREILPAHLPTQRWFGAKQERIESTHVDAIHEWHHDGDRWLLLFVRVELASGSSEMYFLPLALAWGEDEEQWHRLLPVALGKVRHKARVGIVYDAFADPRFARAIVEAMRRNDTVDIGSGVLRFKHTRVFDSLVGSSPEEHAFRRPPVEGTNSAVILDEQLFLKGYRRLQQGTHPEVEIGRFLTDVARSQGAVPTAGSFEFEDADGKSHALGILQGFVENQGDAWNFTLDNVVRYYETAALHRHEAPPADAFVDRAALLGDRTAAMHLAFSRPTGNPAFDAVPMTGEHLGAMRNALEREAGATYDLLESKADVLPAHVRLLARQALDLRRATMQLVNDLLPSEIEDAALTRHHGDYHLGQLLITRNDYVIVDFEGEPARPLEQRREKHSPLRDVAGMLRSFAYAAHVGLDRVSDDRTEARSELVELARSWQRRTETAFLDAYIEAMIGEPTFPLERDARRLIRFFMLEKVLYEVRYEIGNRPDWAHIPLNGLLHLVAADVPAAPARAHTNLRKRSAQPT
jgi:maltose alpha-D-glucosyltransferase/alpha-amylase